MRAYQLIGSLLLLSVWGCQTESETLSPNEASAAREVPAANFRIKQMAVTGNTSGLGPAYMTKRFEYLQGRDLKYAFITPNSPNPTEYTSEYSYDEQGRVSSYLERFAQPRDDGSIGVRHTFTYGQNTFEYFFQYVGADGQGLPNQVNTQRDIYRFNADGQLTQWLQEGIIRYGRPTTARYEYQYENGNIAQATYLNGDNKEEFSIRYQYDDKVNPFYGWMFTIDPVLRYSRNNVVSAQVSQSTPSKTEYTYNEQGLPLTKKDVTNGAVLTYEYEAY